VIALRPANSHAYFGRGFTKKLMKDFLGAAEDFEMAKKLDPYSHQNNINYSKLSGIQFIQLCKPGEEEN